MQIPGEWIALFIAVVKNRASFSARNAKEQYFPDFGKKNTANEHLAMSQEDCPFGCTPFPAEKRLCDDALSIISHRLRCRSQCRLPREIGAKRVPISPPTSPSIILPYTIFNQTNGMEESTDVIFWRSLRFYSHVRERVNSLLQWMPPFIDSLFPGGRVTSLDKTLRKEL